MADSMLESGHAVPADKPMEGKVNGRRVVLSHDQNDGKGEGESALSWTLQEDDSSSPSRQSLPVQNLIGILPVHGKDSHLVLYVDEDATSKEDKSLSPAIFRSVTVSQVPLFRWPLGPHDKSQWYMLEKGTEQKRELHVVVSSGSGTGLAQSVYEQMVKPLLECLEETRGYALHETRSETSILELARDILLPRANKGIAEVVILLSGDGGMVDLVNGVLSEQRSQHYRPPIIVLLPLGTGNALAHSAGITTDNTMGLRTFLHGSPKALPLFRASFSAGARLLVNEGRDEQQLHAPDGTPIAHGAVVASWGLHAALVADSDTSEYRKFGAERFKMAANEALFPSDGSMPHAYKGKISTLQSTSDGGESWTPLERSEHGYVLASLVSHMEKGFNISPSSKPLDGKLWLVDFAAISGKDAMVVMMEAYDGGKHVSNDNVSYRQVEGFRLDFEEEDARWRRVCIDGKIIRVEKGGWMEVRSGVQSVVELVVP